MRDRGRSNLYNLSDSRPMPTIRKFLRITIRGMLTLTAAVMLHIIFLNTAQNNEMLWYAFYECFAKMLCFYHVFLCLGYFMRFLRLNSH